MNMAKFEEQQTRFLFHYPGGFENPEMKAIEKKHNVTKWITFMKDQLNEAVFEDWELAVERITKVVVGSSLVSVFEKTAFKNMIQGMTPNEKEALSESVKVLLYGNQQEGFESLCEVLGQYKNAKWPIITVLMYYANPEGEALVKPTTAKGALEYFEVEAFKYVSKPNYVFYCQFRDWVIGLRKQAVPELQVDNAAFCGFLMFAIGSF